MADKIPVPDSSNLSFVRRRGSILAPMVYAVCGRSWVRLDLDSPPRRDPNGPPDQIDRTSPCVRYIQTRMWQRDYRDRPALQPTRASVIDVLPPMAYSENPSISIATRLAAKRTIGPVSRISWTPTGRLITSVGEEFTLWTDQLFDFEISFPVFKAVKSMCWMHSGLSMLSGHDQGVIKCWQADLMDVEAINSSHAGSVQDLSFCVTDKKFCSVSDDTFVKLWDFEQFHVEHTLIGHASAVKTVDWHPTNSLIASGGNDGLVILWDAMSKRLLNTFHHNELVQSVKWNQNGNWLLTALNDQVKLYDMRKMKEFQSFDMRSHEVTALAWHPYHEGYFVCGSASGHILHFLVDHETPQEIVSAHENRVLDLQWHPMGNVLCSGGIDLDLKFWCRNRPGK